MRRIPNHVIAIDPKSVGARFRSRQLKFLERFRFGIKPADLSSTPLTEPDNPVGIHLEALRLPFRWRIELRDLSVLRHANDRAISFSEDSEQLVSVLTDKIAVFYGDAVMAIRLRLVITVLDGCRCTHQY